MKTITTLIFTILFVGHGLATEITVLNAGSKTGSFAQQALPMRTILHNQDMM